jgi:PAS domain S-box-containing protein
MSVAGIGVWEIDIANNMVHWDDRCCELIGLNKQNAIPYNKTFQYIHPDDLEYVKKSLDSAIQGNNGGVYDASYRTIGADHIVRWVHFTGIAYLNEDGQVQHFGGVARDVTSRHIAQQQASESEEFIEFLSNSVPAMIFYIDKHQCYKSYNDTFMQWYGVGATEAVGLHVRDFIGEAAYTRIQPRLLEALAGQQVSFEMQAPHRINPDRWLSIVYTPDIQNNGTVAGVIVHATDVTGSKHTEIALRQSEAQFRSIFAQAPMGIALMEGRDMVITLCNDKMFEIWGKTSEITGMPLMKALPELEGQPFLELIQNVFDSGIPHFGAGTLAKLKRKGVLEDAYFDFVYTPVRDDEGIVTGIMTLATEVTHREIANQSIARSEARFRSLIEQAPVATCLFTGRELKVEIANDQMVRMWGKDDSVLGKPLSEAVPELSGQPFLHILDQVYTTGTAYSATAARAELEVDGKMRSYYFNFNYKPLFDASGKVYGIIDMAVDVTEQVLARQALEENEIILNNAVELAELATWSLDVATGVVTYSERLKKWLGDDLPEPNLSVLSHVHPDDQERVGSALADTVSGSGRFDEIYKLAGSSSGSARIIHSSGRVHFDEDKNAVRLLGTAQDITVQHDVRAALENQVRVRTEELQLANHELAGTNELLLRSNEELTQYAYVASHDLQEPLRKIQVFTDMLSSDQGLSPASRKLTAKIFASAERMRTLIINLLEFSQLANSDSPYQLIDLNDIIKGVFLDFELAAREKGATFKLDKFPVVEAVSLQMNQLFYNLIGNSLKFTRPQQPPVVSVSCDICSPDLLRDHIKVPHPYATYYRISVKDNGIGFEKQYADQIFEIFKRLHGRKSYPGSGIGLALCRRIVSNHGGVLVTESTPGVGSVFWLILPDRQS